MLMLTNPIARRGTSSCLLGLITLWLLSGCAQTRLFTSLWDKTPVATPSEPVNKIITMWEPGKGPGIDGKSSRGFLGSVMFFTSKSPLPAVVHGSLRVYLFDDRAAPGEEAKPLHEFLLPAETLAAHRQDTPVGVSYGIYVPYTRPGLDEARCMLRVQFTPEYEGRHAGAVSPNVFSEMISISLPGLSSTVKRDKFTGNPVEELATNRTTNKQRGESDEITQVGHTQAGQSADAERRPHDVIPAKARPTAAQRAVPLTASERERILRQFQPGVQTAGHEAAVEEEVYEDEPRPARRVKRRATPSRNTPRVTEDVETIELDDDADQVFAVAPSSRSNRRTRSAVPRGEPSAPPVEDFEEETDPADEFDRAVGSRPSRPSAASQNADDEWEDVEELPPSR